MNKVDINDEFMRRAIWEINNHRCFYTGNPIEYSDMELDHIIPSKYRNMPNELKKIIDECGLEEDFEIDSLYNLVPTSKFNNRRKSDSDLQNKLFYLDMAKRKVPAIIKRIEQLKNKRNYDEHLSMLKNHIDEQKEKPDREKLLNEIISFISNENKYFDELEEIINKDKEQIFRKYTKRIGLEAILPKYNNPETTCIISFRNAKVSDSKLIVGNTVILNKLFSGLFTDPKYGCREFIEAKEINQNNQQILDLDNAIIHLENSKLKLPKDDICELCKIIDVFANKYLESIKNIENILKTDAFPLSKRRNNYKFITITYSDWRKILEFGVKHDVENGRSHWHIFDRNNYYLKIYTDKKNPEYNFGYHAFFHVECDEDVVLYPDMTSNELIVTWEFIEDLDIKGTNYINERENWNAEIAYNWFVNKLKPKVLGQRRKAKNSDRSFRTVFKLNDEKITSIANLVEIISQLQRYYYLHPYTKYRISSTDIKGIYNSIAICLRRGIKADIYYISNKLHLNECKTITQLTDSILDLAENVEDITISGFGIDLLFRGLLAALESKKINLAYEDIELIRNNINFFIETHDREVILEKYALEFA